jgi:predicted hydrolase (HD superfamily)
MYRDSNSRSSASANQLTATANVERSWTEDQIKWQINGLRDEIEQEMKSDGPDGVGVSGPIRIEIDQQKRKGEIWQMKS